MFALLISAVVGVNAQTAYEAAKVFDNVSVGVTGGISSPLNFNSVTPFNTNFGIRLQKDFTPVVGVQAEGLAFVNGNHFANDINTWVKATNVGVNGVLNLSNLIGGYKGSPRVFEVSTVTGIGWLYKWDTSSNYLSSKTGVDLAFNLGNEKQHSIVLTPAVYWNLSSGNGVEFNRNHAQLAVNVAYVYHFKTSNGTHHFKTHDIGLLNDEINKLKEENVGLKNVVKSLNDEKSKLNSQLAALNSKDGASSTLVDNVLWVIQFAQGSSNLSSDAKNVLDKVVKANKAVDVVATASPEGSKSTNKTLSEKRADAVVKYLTNNGVTVKQSVGLGATSNTANRLALITLSK